MSKNAISFAVMLVTLALQANAEVKINKSHDSSKPVEITAESLEVMQAENKAIFTGDVQAKQDNLDLRAEKMTVFYKKNDKNKTPADKQAQNNEKTTPSKISKVIIENNIIISTPNETAKGNKGVFDVDNSIITLTGDVTLMSQKNIVKGQNLVYNLKTGVSKIISNSGDSKKSGKKERVRGVFVPSK